MTIPQPTFDAAREARQDAYDAAHDRWRDVYDGENLDAAIDAAVDAAQAEWEKPLRELLQAWRKEMAEHEGEEMLAMYADCANELESALATVRGEKSDG